MQSETEQGVRETKDTLMVFEWELMGWREGYGEQPSTRS